MHVLTKPCYLLVLLHIVGLGWGKLVEHIRVWPVLYETLYMIRDFHLVDICCRLWGHDHHDHEHQAYREEKPTSSRDEQSSWEKRDTGYCELEVILVADKSVVITGNTIRT